VGLAFAREAKTTFRWGGLLKSCGWPARQVLEECGFRVDPQNVKPLASYAAAIGFSGSRHSMFFVDVDDSMRVGGSGGGLE